MTSPLPCLFDGRGAFCPLSDEAQAALSEANRVAYQKIARCDDNLKVTDANVATTIERIKVCSDAVVEVENFIRTTFPPKTFHELWRETFKRE